MAGESLICMWTYMDIDPLEINNEHSAATIILLTGATRYKEISRQKLLQTIHSTSN